MAGIVSKVCLNISMVYSLLAWSLIPLNCTLLRKLKLFVISGITVSICSPVIAVRRTRSGKENFPSPVPTKKLSVTRDRQRYLPFTKASIPAAGTLCNIRDVHLDAVNWPIRRALIYSPYHQGWINWNRAWKYSQSSLTSSSHKTGNETTNKEGKERKKWLITQLWLHLGGLLRIQEVRMAFGYRLLELLRFFYLSLATCRVPVPWHQLNRLPCGFFGSVKKGKYIEDSILAPGQLISSLYIAMILRAITFLCFELPLSIYSSRLYVITFLISYQMLFVGESLQFYSLSYFILYAHYTTPQIFCCEFLSS